MKMEIELQPIRVPNFISQKTKSLPEEGDCPKYPLTDLSPKVLAELCDQFRQDVFRQAGKKDPGQVCGDS